jgi:hypothetical protein
MKIISCIDQPEVIHRILRHFTPFSHLSHSPSLKSSTNTCSYPLTPDPSPPHKPLIDLFLSPTIQWVEKGNSYSLFAADPSSTDGQCYAEGTLAAGTEFFTIDPSTGKVSELPEKVQEFQVCMSDMMTLNKGFVDLCPQ